MNETLSRDEWLPPPRPDDDVLRGKDGWLFLHNDSNQALLQYVGRVRLSEDELRQWQRVLDARISWLAGRGTAYRFLVPPGPQSVYPEKLPDDLLAGAQPERRPVAELQRHLERSDSKARLLYPIEEILRRREQRPFAKTSMHWTDLGAFIAYECLVDAIAGEVSARRLTEDDMEFWQASVPGDLGPKVDPPEQSDHVFARVRRSEAAFVDDNRVLLNGRRIEYRCEAAPAVTCMVHGDSYSYNLLPMLAETFRRVVFGHIATLDRDFIERERPDLVVTVVNERFLVRVPDDAGGRSLQAWAELKREQGLMYAPRRSNAGTRVDSPLPEFTGPLPEATAQDAFMD